MPDSARIFRTPVFILRSVLPLLVAALAMFAALKRSLGGGAGSESLFLLVAQLDVYRGLAYCLLPLGAILLFLPRLSVDGARRGAVELIVSILIGAAAGVLPLSVCLLLRPGLALGHGNLLTALYVALNAFLLARLHAYGSERSRWTGLLPRLYLVSDLLLPLGLWAAYAARGARLQRALRILPCLAVCSAPLLPWILAPQPFDSDSVFHPALSAINCEDEHYQVVVHPDTGNLMVVTNLHGRLYILDPRTGQDLARQDIGRMNQQAMAYLPAADELAAVFAQQGATVFLDARTLDIKRTVQIADVLVDPGSPDGGHLWRTMVYPDGSALAAYSMDWFVLLSPEGDRILATHHGRLSFPALDSMRGELHLSLFEPGGLAVLDAQSLEEKRSIQVPGFADRMGIDPQTDRLYVALPMQGQVLVVDLESYEIVRRLDAFPGVRAMLVDTAGRRLFLAGFSPVLEVRDLDDLSLQARLRVPPWVRWIAVSRDGHTVFFTTAHAGIWRIDMDKIDDQKRSAWSFDDDPFYRTSSRLGRFAMVLLGAN